MAEKHTRLRLFLSEWVESIHSAFEVWDSQTQPETPNGNHTTPHVWRETQMETPQARHTDLKQTWTPTKRTAYQAEETWN